MNEKTNEKMKNGIENKELKEIVERYIPSWDPKPVWVGPLYEYLEDKWGLVTKYTVQKYARELASLFSELEMAKFESDPRRIGRRDIKYLIVRWQDRDLHHNTIVWKLSHLGSILKFHGNSALQDMHLNLKIVERPHARWLPLEIMDVIFEVAEELGPSYGLRIHLGHDLLLRKSEMLRLKIRDISYISAVDGDIHVIGKGRNGGKEVMLPFAPDTPSYLAPHFEWREKLIKEAEMRDEPMPGKDWIFIWYRKGMGIGHEGKTTADNRMAPIIEEVRRRMKLPPEWRFGYHDLRRTGARRYWIDGMDLLAIQALLRHESIETTIRYLGLKKEIARRELSRLGSRRTREYARDDSEYFEKRIRQLQSIALRL